MPTPLLRCEALLVGHAGKAVLPPITMQINAGEFWIVVGRNGSGKTTWFRTLLGLLRPIGGSMRWAEPRPRLAHVPQRSAFDELYPLPAEQVVRLGAERGLSFLSPLGDRGARARAALAEVEIPHLAERNFRSLSEGQKQRVLLARMIASEAQLALLDEPTAAMDAIAEAEAMALLDGLRRRHGIAVVVVSHHLPAALPYADRMLFLDPDLGVEAGSPSEVRASAAWRTRHGGAGGG